MNSLWQHPHVNVFKHFDVGSFKKAAKEGDVSSSMDKSIKCTVWRIAGVIPANNYLQVPQTGSQSLGLTGRYVYLAFKPIPERFFVSHLDIVSSDGLIIRISFSNLFKEFKSTSTWLQFPFVVSPAGDSVDQRTAVLSTTKTAIQAGAAPSTTRWTLLALDLQYILSVYLNRQFSHVKAIRLCANAWYKGIYSSDNYYEPGYTPEEARRLHLSDRGVECLPRELSFPLSKSEVWHEKYDLIRFPCDASKVPVDRFRDSEVAVVSKKSSHNKLQSSRSKAENIPSQRKSSKKTRFTDGPVLPEVGLDDPNLADELSAARRPGHSKEKDRVIFAPINTNGHAASKREVRVVSRKGTLYDHDEPERDVPRDVKVAEESEDDVDEMLDTRRKSSYKTLQPDPILKLHTVIGLTPSSITKSLAFWTQGGNYIVYASHALVVALHVATQRQRHFIGHTSNITGLSLSRDSTLLASAQSENTCVRLWSYKSGDCLSVFKVSGTAINGLSFSESGSLLVGHGKDNHGKTLVVVWDTSRVLKGGEVSLIAKAHTDVDIVSLKVSPADEFRFVSCGRSNVRVWRLKDSGLRSAAIPLGDQHTCEFSDVCWDYEPNASSQISRKTPDQRKVYACTKSGHILEIDHNKMAVKEVHKLLPKQISKDFDKKTFTTGSGIALESIFANDTFCVTGSSDGYLRVWPLDFKHVYLEAEHDGPVTSVQMSDNGLKILAVTNSGNLGVLDVTTRSYTTLMRSHVGRVTDASLDAIRRHLVTISTDRTIRVWSLETCQQLYDFHSANDMPVTVAYHPSRQVFAAGFESGSVRVFDICGTSLLADLGSHRGPVTGLVFSPAGDRLYSCSSDGSLACYDASEDSYSVLRLLGGVVAPGEKYGPQALALSPHGELLAFVGPQPFTVTVVSSRSLDDCLRIDITCASGPIEAARGLVDQARLVCFTPSNPGHLLVVTEQNKVLKLNAQTGSLVGEITNLHRKGVTALETSKDGGHLITSGDRGMIKVWDYGMRLDMNFQVFIGHSESVPRLMFAPNHKQLISCGESIFIWDYLADTSPLDRDDERDNMLARMSLRDAAEEEKSQSSPHSYPRPPTRSISNQQLVESDEESNDTTDLDIPRGTAPQPSTPKSHLTSPQVHLTPADPLLKTPVDLNMLGSRRRTPQKGDRAEELLYNSSYISPTRSICKTGQSNTNAAPLPPPKSFKHFIPRERNSTFAQKRYVAPADQAGLELVACLGYNGNARDSIIWQPETGLFAYTCGCVIVIEDLKTGEQKHLIGHTEEISTVAVQSDCQEMASASGPKGLSSSQLCIWDLQTMSCRKVMNDHASNIVSLAYSRDDRFLVSLGDYKERRICIWETVSCSLVASTTVSQPLHHVAWDPQACNEFVTVGADAAIMFWLLDELSGPGINLRVQEPRVPPELLERTTEADKSRSEFTVASYAGDRMLYIGSSDGTISAWETRKNTCVLHWCTEGGEITSLIARRGQLVTASKHSKLRLWSLAGLAELALPSSGVVSSPSHTQVEIQSEMSLDGLGVTSFVMDDVLDMGIVGTDCGSLWYINWPESSSVRLTTTNHASINSIHFLPSNPAAGSRLCTCSDDGTLRVWSIDEREQILQFQVLDQRCMCCCSAPDPDTGHIEGRDLKPTYSSHLLAAGYSDGTLRVFDLNRAEMVMKVQPHRCCLTSIIYAHAGLIISGDEDGFVALTSSQTGMTTRIMNDHKGAPISGLDSAPWRGGEYPRVWLASSADRRVSVWEADWSKDVCQLVDWMSFPAPSFGPGGQRMAKITGKAYYTSLPPSIARFSVSEKDVIVYTGYGLEKVIQFYNIRLKQTVRTIPLTNWARSMALSPNGQLIATGIDERLVKLHDYTEGTFQDYIGSDDSVSGVVFSPNGKNLIATSDRCMYLWKVNV